MYATCLRMPLIAVAIGACCASGCMPWDPVIIRQRHILSPESDGVWTVEKILIEQRSRPSNPEELGRVSITLELENNRRMKIFVGYALGLPGIRMGERLGVDDVANEPQYYRLEEVKTFADTGDGFSGP